MSKLHLYSAFLFLLFVASCKKEDNDPVVEEVSYDAAQEHNLLDQSYGSDAKQKYDIYLPVNRNTSSTPVLFIIHGGGWTSGSKNGFDDLLPTIKNLFPKYALVRINYRLYNGSNPDKNRFPSQELDIKECIEHVFNRKKNYVISTNFGLWGQSAGAHLAALYAYKYQNKPYKAKALINQVGPMDMMSFYQQSTNDTIKFILSSLMGNPSTIDSNLYISSSPYRYVNASACPTLIMHGNQDAIVPYQQAEMLKDKLQSLGVTHVYKLYNGQGHGLEGVYLDVANEMVNFLNTHLK
jgi:acetyl esterase/lipase